MTPNERELLTALQNAGTDASVADILRRNQLANTADARKKLGSQLCKLRDKELVTSYQRDGVNYWNLAEAGWKALGRDMPTGIPAPEAAPESPAIQADVPDISADSPASLVLSGKTRLAFEALPDFAAIRDAAEPELADQLEYEPDGPDDINPALVQESVRIRPVAPFARINDALFVLDTLAIAYCHGMPAYQTEITRIADYLREAAA